MTRDTALDPPAAADAVALARAVLTQPIGDDPYPAYRRLAERAPIVTTGAFTLVSRYDHCRAILRDPAFLVVDGELRDRIMPWWRNTPALRLATGSLVFSNPPEHERIRPVMAGAFTRRRVADLRSMIGTRVAELVEHIGGLGGGGEAFDFVGEFANKLPIHVVADLLGIPEADRDWFVPLAGEYSAALDPFWGRGQLAAADRAADALAPYCRRLADRQPDGDNVIAALCALHRADPEALSMDGLVRNIALLLVASYETTSALLTSGLRLLFAHPEQRTRLRADPALAPRYVEEMLRYESPVQIAARWTRADTTVGGAVVPARSIVLLLLGAANRDPARFPDPDAFTPDRFGADRPEGHALAFGSGAHLCAGAWLARMEAAEAFVQLVERFPDLAPAGEPAYRPRRWLRSYESLPVTTTAR